VSDIIFSIAVSPANQTKDKNGQGHDEKKTNATPKSNRLATGIIMMTFANGMT
jgi:hypothetical protein